METYVTSYIIGEGNEREELVTYAGPNRSLAFSFKVDDFGNHSIMVDVWVLGWLVGTYGIGEEFSSDKWILNYRDLLQVTKPIAQLNELLEEKTRILNELQKEI